MSATIQSTLKIATWNVMRPRVSSKRNLTILEQLKNIDADILVLTEKNTCINTGEQYTAFSTAPLYGTSSKFGEPYRVGEKRVAIWSKNSDNAIEIACQSRSGVCVQLGELIVYGTVIGPYGRGGSDFYEDLKSQIEDWERISKLGHICIAGDFNIAFKGRYFTKKSRADISACFRNLDIQVPTQDMTESVDHIALSKSFLQNFSRELKTWNEGCDKKNMSDHRGICLTLNRQ